MLGSASGWRGWWRRASVGAVAVVLLVAAACSDGSDNSDSLEGGDAGAGTEVPRASETTAGSFLGLNGWMWFYTTADEIRFADITARLVDLHDQGIRVLGIYSPYRGEPDRWLGCVARDFYDTVPVSGTLADFRALVDAAHERDMKVVAYFGNLNIDRRSDFFRTAEQQYAAGDRTSREVSAFHWAEDDQGPLPTPAAGPSEWAYSDTAGAYYWSFWGEPGFDLDLPGARAEVVRAERFWLDTGLDGFMFDSGVADPELREVMVDLPITYTPNDKWLTFEATAAEDFDSYVEFGITSWFNLEDNDEANDYSLIANGPATADDLEEALAGAAEAHDEGRLTHAWSPWEPDAYPDPAMRVQEAALLAGAGVAYGAPSWSGFLDWPEDARARWSRVLATVNAHPALAPNASIDRVPTGSDPKTYAMLRTAEDGTQTALLVYNLQGERASVPVDLSATNVAPDQTPVNLYGDEPAAPMTSTTYTLELPAYGFALLDVATT